MHEQMKTFPIAGLVMDPATQSRARLSDEVIAEYAEAMRAGATFPPVTAFGADGEAYLADGWHRVLAARESGVDEIEVDLRAGACARRSCMPSGRTRRTG